jgi:hypothetical protein
LTTNIRLFSRIDIFYGKTLSKGLTTIVPETNACAGQAWVKPVGNKHRTIKFRGRIHPNAHIFTEGFFGRINNYIRIQIKKGL